MSLDKYKQKRDFTQTPEPEGINAASNEKHIFVIQRHAATRLHYDFRLEMEKVLKSWAVPKGPSMNPKDKRLAMMVEDHPYSYRTFEGTIPKGNYGAGEVEIWDEGTYEPLHKKDGQSDEQALLEGLKSGSVKIIMHGKKIKGEFALVKMQSAKDDNAWLLLKHNDEFAVKEPYDSEDYTSSSSKVTELAEKKYKSFKEPKVKEKSRRNYASHLSGQQKLTDFIQPMLATTADKPFSGEEWLFEIKWDGYRAIADLTEDVKLYSRNGLSFLGKYPSIEKALASQEHQMILDGEIVAYNDADKPDFQTLQHYDDNPEAVLVYHVFDLLYLNGYSTQGLPLLQRKELLKDALKTSAHIQLSDYVENTGKEFYKAVLSEDLEGMMAKKKESLYHMGSRSSDWVKVKNHKTEEAVIIGFTEPQGGRKYFGSLILGKYDNGKLIYAGHVGTGFDDKTLKKLFDLMQPYTTVKMPLDKKPPVNSTPTWITPEMVATIKFSQITEEGIFRHPVFVGLREDLKAKNLQDDSISNAPTTMKKEKTEIDKGEMQVKFTNLNKLYWEEEKITKGDLIDYYLSISDYILPHLKDRAQSMHRFPNGIDGMSFYHKDAGKDAPDFVKTALLYSESNDKDIEYVVCNNKDTLAYMINLGCIELNPWNSRVQTPENPDYLIIDLDPSDNNTFKQVIEAAKVAKEVLDMGGIKGYCKTSGSTGIHIYIPMGAEYEYEHGKEFAHIIMQMVLQRLPKTTTLERALNKRDGKIYLDYLQNRAGQTIASVYSVRPKRGATVSMPLEWDELTPDLSPKDFTIHNALERIKSKGDIFAPVLTEKTNIEKVLANFGL